MLEHKVKALFQYARGSDVGFREFEDWAHEYMDEGLLFWVFELDRLSRS